MERRAQRIVIFGVAGLMVFGGLFGLGVAASSSSVVPAGAAHVNPAVLTVGPTVPGTPGVVAYLATFTETGLPFGTPWFVNITGQTALTTTSTSISTLLADGSYSYSVASANRGYGAPSGSFAVSGASVAMTAGFAAITHPAYNGPTTGALSTAEWVVIGVVVAAVVVALVAIAWVPRSHRLAGTARPPAA